MPTADDHDRVRRFIAAFDELFARAVRVARRILTDQATAEDVAAEALARAFASWDRIDTSAAYRTAWVLRVATNLAIDVVRHRANREALVDVTGEDLTHPSVIADEQDAAATRLVLFHALRELPRRQQEALSLRYLVGMSQAETARALGVAPGTVARHVHRGLAGLRAQLPDLAPAAVEVEELVTGGKVKIHTIEEAVQLRGTDTVVRAHVRSVLPGQWGWNVDIGIPAVLVMRGMAHTVEVSELVGEDVNCVVVDVDPDRERVVVARTMDTPEESAEFERRRRLVASLRPGQVRKGRVHALVPFGAFVDVEGHHGLLSASWAMGSHTRRRCFAWVRRSTSRWWIPTLSCSGSRCGCGRPPDRRSLHPGRSLAQWLTG